MNDQPTSNQLLLFTLSIDGLTHETIEQQQFSPHKCNNKYHFIFVLSLLAFAGMKIIVTSSGLHNCCFQISAFIWLESHLLTKSQWTRLCNNDNAIMTICIQGKQKSLNVSPLLEIVRGKEHRVCWKRAQSDRILPFLSQKPPNLIF